MACPTACRPCWRTSCAQRDPERGVQDNAAGGSNQVMVDGQSRPVLSYLRDFLFSPERALLDSVVTRSLVFEGNGVVQDDVGGYEDWLRQHARAPAAAPKTLASASVSPDRPRPSPRARWSNPNLVWRHGSNSGTMK